MAAAPIIIVAAAAAFSAYSSYKSGQAQKSAEDKAAKRAKRAAAAEALDTEKQHRRIIASQEARYGASGLTMEGSPLLVHAEAIRESKLQLERIREGGQYTASTYRAAGNEAQRAGIYGGIKDLLGGASGVYNAGAGYNWW